MSISSYKNKDFISGTAKIGNGVWGDPIPVIALDRRHYPIWLDNFFPTTNTELGVAAAYNKARKLVELLNS